MEELLETVFSARSVKRQYKELDGSMRDCEDLMFLSSDL
jgi:hypothetical protein